MRQRLTEKTVRELATPEKNAKVYFDDWTHKDGVKGLGVRVTANGARTFVYEYRPPGGDTRRYTIGKFPDWSVSAARKAAAELREDVRAGIDPQQAKSDDKTAPTVNDLIERYRAEHLEKKRETSRRDDEDMIRLYIAPRLGKKKVADVTLDHVEALHRDITQGKCKGQRKPAPYRANRVVSLLSKMFNLAIDRWKMRDQAEGNPCRGVRKNPEEDRERFLEDEEIARLIKALTELDDRQAANVIMLALLTGARRGEILKAKWSQFDLPKGKWKKPASHTKQDRIHRVVLSPESVVLLMAIREADPKAIYVFPSPKVHGAPRQDVKPQWERVRKTAGLDDLRFHDLRHTYASLLISDGVSLNVIGRLLGHTQAQTTMRYAHLADEPLREATNRVGKRIREA
jgi:integrase